MTVRSVAMTESGPGIRRIGQIALNAKDIDRAIGFYRDTLGLTLLFQAGPSLAFFDCGGVRLMIESSPTEGHDHPASILYYVVDDIVASHAALESRGVTMVDAPHLLAKMPDHDLWMAFYEDTEGNTLALMCEVRPPAPA